MTVCYTFTDVSEEHGGSRARRENKQTTLRTHWVAGGTLPDRSVSYRTTRPYENLNTNMLQAHFVSVLANTHVPFCNRRLLHHCNAPVTTKLFVSSRTLTFLRPFCGSEWQGTEQLMNPSEIPVLDPVKHHASLQALASHNLNSLISCIAQFEFIKIHCK